MKKSLKLILPLVVVALIFTFMWRSDSIPKQVSGDAVVSEDGSAEIVDFHKALANEQYDQAAHYIQLDCEVRRCFEKNLEEDEVADFLRTMCETRVCQEIELTVIDDSTSDIVRVHGGVYLDEDGNQERLCISEDCRIQKQTFSMRVASIDGKWFVTEQPPLKY